MDIATLLVSVESEITDQKEREYFWIHEVRYKRILEQIEPLTRGGKKIRALDVGCFPYHLGACMEKMGIEVYGIASNHEPVKKKRIAVLNIETDPFPYKNDFFDLVIFTEVLEHLPQAPVVALRQIHRVLSPGGLLVLTTPNIGRSINRAKMLLGKSITYPLHQILEKAGEGSNIYHRHNREYTLTECIDLLKFAKFRIDRAETFVSYTPFRRRPIPEGLIIKAGKIVNYALMQMIMGMRDTLLLVASK